jgi:hypothetical protein
MKSEGGGGPKSFMSRKGERSQMPDVKSSKFESVFSSNKARKQGATLLNAQKHGTSDLKNLKSSKSHAKLGVNSDLKISRPTTAKAANSRTVFKADGEVKRKRSTSKK